jgi:hypothetical protein
MKPRTAKQTPTPYFAGLDFLKVSLWLDWDTPDFKLMLHNIKDDLHDPDFQKNPDAKEISLELSDGTRFNVQATGAGKYPYVIKSGDITILFSNHKPDAQFPNCRIEIGSMSCWQPGWNSLFTNITYWLRDLGASIVQQKVTECHVTADLLGINFDDTDFSNPDRWTARANKGSQHFEHYITNYLSLGKGDFMFRCYNKTGELVSDSAKHDFFHDLWRAHSGEDVKHVTRLEFQIRRSVIKKLEIKSVYDLSMKLNSIWAYCVGDPETTTSGWCRFLDREISESDRKHKNHQRYATDSLWELVRSVRFNKGRTLKMVRKKTQHVNIELLTRQGTGCLLGVCGAVGLAEDDYEGHILFVSQLVTEQIYKNYRKDKNEYIRKIGTKYNTAELTF